MKPRCRFQSGENSLAAEALRTLQSWGCDWERSAESCCNIKGQDEDVNPAQEPEGPGVGGAYISSQPEETAPAPSTQSLHHIDPQLVILSGPRDKHCPVCFLG
ncbi:unnamed protein product [Lota lota]